MARTQDQKRWRDKSALKRVEVNLPADAVTKLDLLARRNNQSRAKTIESLIEASTHNAHPRQSYVFRRPATPTERRYTWIVDVDGESLIGLKRDDFQGWVGLSLRPSMFTRPCKRKTRDGVVQEMLSIPELYR